MRSYNSGHIPIATCMRSSIGAWKFPYTGCKAVRSQSCKEGAKIPHAKIRIGFEIVPACFVDLKLGAPTLWIGRTSKCFPQPTNPSKILDSHPLRLPTVFPCQSSSSLVNRRQFLSIPVNYRQAPVKPSQHHGFCCRYDLSTRYVHVLDLPERHPF